GPRLPPASPPAGWVGDASSRSSGPADQPLAGPTVLVYGYSHEAEGGPGPSAAAVGAAGGDGARRDRVGGAAGGGPDPERAGGRRRGAGQPQHRGAGVARTRGRGRRGGEGRRRGVRHRGRARG